MRDHLISREGQQECLFHLYFKLVGYKPIPSWKQICENLRKFYLKILKKLVHSEETFQIILPLLKFRGSQTLTFINKNYSLLALLITSFITFNPQCPAFRTVIPKEIFQSRNFQRSFKNSLSKHQILCLLIGGVCLL